MGNRIMVRIADRGAGVDHAIELTEAVARALPHIEQETFLCIARHTALGPETITRGVSGRSSGHLDLDGVVQMGTEVRPGDLLVGKTTPQTPPSSPEEKLLNAIFGDKGNGARDTSLRVPPGVRGTVSAVERPPIEDGEVCRVAVTVTWTRPVVPGDVIDDEHGRRAVVTSVTAANVRWAGHPTGSARIGRVVSVEEVSHARSIGPYALVNQQPLSGKRDFGGQKARPALLRGLLAQGAPFVAFELVSIKGSHVEGRARLYEQLIRSEPPTFEPFDPDAVPATPVRTEYFVQPMAIDPVAVASLDYVQALFSRDCGGVRPPRTHLAAAAPRWVDHPGRELGAVTRHATVDGPSLRPVPGGLFCQRVFGPVKDYACACGKFARLKHRGVVCDQCGVEVTMSRVRRTRSGHVALPVPVVHPLWRDWVAERLDLSTEQIGHILAGTSTINGMVPTSLRQTLGFALRDAMGSEPLADAAILDALPVLPPALRPMMTSPLNHRYAEVVELAQSFDPHAPDAAQREHGRQLQQAVDNLIDDGSPLDGSPETLLGQLSDALRRLTRLVVDYSAMSVAVPRTEVSPGTCAVPRWMAIELLKPFLISELEKRSLEGSIRAARQRLERLIAQDDPDPEGEAVLAAVLTDRWVWVALDHGASAQGGAFASPLAKATRWAWPD